VTNGLVVRSVEPGSQLDRAGLRPGDTILAVDGLVPRDAIDLQLDLPGARSLSLRRGHGATVDLAISGADASGLVLAEAFPGGIRTCTNHCEFCFIRGLPPGLRPSLYVFDDDYRYSFLWGTFLTLTNLSGDDWSRIGFQRLSPLNVSVHATDPTTRNRLLNNRYAPPILPQLRRLARLGIRVHTQVVLCVGINDGVCLERTIEDLAELYPAVQSLSVVPVASTRYSRWRTIRRPSPADAAAVLESCECWQARLRPRLGVNFVYASDELYLLAGRRELPPAVAYDGFPVLSNGVGLLRQLTDDWQRLLARRRALPPPEARRVIWLTGRLARPALEEMAERWAAYAGWRPGVRVVDNVLFGEQVTVSGLLSGADLVRELERVSPDVEDIVVPRGAFGFAGETTLDGLTAEQVGSAHVARVHLAATPGELLGILELDGRVGNGRRGGRRQTDQQEPDPRELRATAEALPARRRRAAEPQARDGGRCRHRGRV
jgi:putative radical SAM enzyme (TIGR03279 family)